MFQSPGWSCQSSILFKHHLAVGRGGSFGVAQEPVQITVLVHLDMDYRMRSVSSWVSGQTISWVREGHPNPGGIPHSRQTKTTWHQQIKELNKLLYTWPSGLPIDRKPFAARSRRTPLDLGRASGWVLHLPSLHIIRPPSGCESWLKISCVNKGNRGSILPSNLTNSTQLSPIEMDSFFPIVDSLFTAVDPFAAASPEHRH